MGLSSFAAEKGEGEVDAFDFRRASLGVGVLAALDVRVVAVRERDSAVLAAVAFDDLGDGMEQLGRHGHDAFAIGLGRRDDQQGDDFAVGALVVADAQVGQLQELLDAFGRSRARRNGTTGSSGERCASRARRLALSSTGFSNCPLAKWRWYS
ncbi:hypothetical protein ACXC9Q_05495 [Kribbella sp. CWNU-51]